MLTAGVADVAVDGVDVLAHRFERRPVDGVGERVQHAELVLRMVCVV